MRILRRLTAAVTAWVNKPEEADEAYWQAVAEEWRALAIRGVETLELIAKTMKERKDVQG